MALSGTRVLKAHTQAVFDTLNSKAHLLSESPAEFADAMAAAVLTANDSKIRYIVVTDDYVAYGPYATKKAANNAVMRGHCAHRHDTQALVLPLGASPKDHDIPVIVPSPDGEQLTLFDLEDSDE